MDNKKHVPRGIRNNNPLNIRKGNNWKGERPSQVDKAFEEFTSMTYGIRAGFIIIRRYMSGYNGLTEKFNTIEKIVRRWAPPTENATQKYIDQVAKETGISPRLKLSFSDKKSMCSIVSAMIHVECGQLVDMNTIESAYDLV